MLGDLDSLSPFLSGIQVFVRFQSACGRKYTYNSRFRAHRCRFYCRFHPDEPYLEFLSESRYRSCCRCVACHNDDVCAFGKQETGDFTRTVDYVFA